MEIYTTSPILDKQVIQESIMGRATNILGGIGKIADKAGEGAIRIAAKKAVNYQPKFFGKGFVQSLKTGKGIDKTIHGNLQRTVASLKSNAMQAYRSGGVVKGVKSLVGGIAGKGGLVRQLPGAALSYAQKNPEAVARAAAAVGRGIIKGIGGSTPGATVASRLSGDPYSATPRDKPEQDKSLEDAEKRASALASRYGIAYDRALSIVLGGGG